jgi:phenylalanyl-tRNA synthetase alpha chain
MRRLGSLPAEERPAFGQRVNAIKNELTAVLEARRAELLAQETGRKLLLEAVDVTRPGRAPAVGRRHPLTQTFERVADIMVGLGFQQVDGPEVEHYQYNFAALNFQEEHPALDEQASFYVTENLLLRTQTTALQGRVMPALEPPFRIFTQGRCFRYEAVDATHYHTFHQVDAFMVDRRVTLADLKGTLAAMARELFGCDVTVRFRPDFFPFVEPGVEIAVRLPNRWLELGGAGMIHPNVLRHVGIDPEEWSGFAFGLGLDRMPMVARGITDIRLLFENDLRLLKQA